PATRAGAKLADLVRRMEFTLHLEQRLAELAPGGGKIERRANLSAGEFYERYYCANRPVVLTGMPMPAWTPQGLAERFGDVDVEICAERDGDPELLKNLSAHSRREPLRGFVERVLAAGETNDFYMVATNRNVDAGPLAALIDEAPDFAGYFDRERRAAAHYLWFGPKGTRTPLHHDMHNLMFCQISGRKRFHLVSPRETRLLYHSDGFTAKLDAATLAGAHEVVLEPGEALFLPIGWWHQVQALDVAISFSLTNFVLPTEFEGLVGSLIREPLI
ncbi:MAG: Cupin superfamily protein, partial [Cyanobacteria bacterium RYN_339]|nr:Cupin superfamily protein [Cyanobacteria bacterium RYN_339]